jgi:hypothetical protein
MRILGLWAGAMVAVQPNLQCLMSEESLEQIWTCSHDGSVPQQDTV